MKPSYREIFTKILVAYDTMEPSFLYYFDEDDCHVKKVDKKKFNYFEKHYADFSYSDDPNSEEYLFAELLLDESKHILPAKFADTELKRNFEFVKNEFTSFEAFKLDVYSKTIDIWLDFHNIFEIECDDSYYSTLFTNLATIFNSGLFQAFSKKNIIQYDGVDGMFFYNFNRKDMSLTITTDYFGLSNMQCNISIPYQFDKQVLRSLRYAYVINFKNESRCTQDTVALFEKYENEYNDFGQFVPKFTFYKYGLMQENSLRIFQGHELSKALFNLIAVASKIVDQELSFTRDDCIKYTHKSKGSNIEITKDFTTQSIQPFINLYAYRIMPQNVKINKGQEAEFVIRVSSTKKISKTTKAKVFELLLVDHNSNEVLFQNFVVSSLSTINDILTSLLEYFTSNGFAEKIYTSNLLDHHIIATLSSGKIDIEETSLTAIENFDNEEKNAIKIMA